MLNEQVKGYIDECRKKGFTDAQIRQALVNAGWTENDALEQLGPSAAAPAGIPSASDLLKQAYALYRSRLPLLAGIAVAPFLLSIASFFLNGQHPSGPMTYATPAYIVITLVYGIAALVIGFASNIAFIAGVMGAPGMTVSAAYKKAFSVFFPVAWISFLTAAAVLGGVVLLVVPGILVSLWVSQAVYVLLAEDKRKMAALVKSWHYVTGSTGAFVWRSLFFALVTLLALFAVWLVFGGSSLFVSGIKSAKDPQALFSIVTLGSVVSSVVSDFIVTPLGAAYFYLLFLALRASKTEALTEEKERAIHKKLKALMVIAGIAVITVPLILLTVVLGSFKMH